MTNLMRTVRGRNISKIRNYRSHTQPQNRGTTRDEAVSENNVYSTPWELQRKGRGFRQWKAINRNRPTPGLTPGPHIRWGRQQRPGGKPRRASVHMPVGMRPQLNAA